MVMRSQTALLGSVAGIAVALSSAPSFAGGFAVRQHSTYSQGAAYAGAAANGQLSAMFWNSAAAANLNGAGPVGLNFDSNYALVLPDVTVTVNTLGGAPVSSALDRNSDIADLSVIPASYLNYQFKNFDPRLYFGMALNGHFGSSTKPDDTNYAGSILGRSSRFKSFILNPMLAYQFTPQLAVGVGLQAMYATGTFKFATGSTSGPNTFFEGDGLAVGATAGVTWKPVAGTTVGLGYRSHLTVDLDGRFATNGASGIAAFGAAGPLIEAGIGATAEINLPELVTLSLTQVVTPNLRLLATGEWAGWSRFKELRVVAEQPGRTALQPGGINPGQTVGVIPANWDDGWFVSVGGEYDVTKQLTVRGGIGYEWSPIQSATQRIIGIPDSDRVWLSGGLSYAWSQSLSIDFAYTHIFFDDGPFDRRTLPAPGQTLGTSLTGNVDATVDIVSIGLRSRW